MIEIWQSLSDTYKYPDPDQFHTIWRADKVGKAAIGMMSTYDGNPAAAVLEAAQTSDDAISDIVHAHVARSTNSPVVSPSNDLRLAQYFARQTRETLYEISLPAHRIIRDPLRLSGSKWEDTGEELTEELFVIGGIFPDDIIAVKMNNADPAASERLIIPSSKRFRRSKPYEALDMSDFKGLPIPESPNPTGIWENPRYAA